MDATEMEQNNPDDSLETVTEAAIEQLQHENTDESLIILLKAALDPKTKFNIPPKGNANGNATIEYIKKQKVLQKQKKCSDEASYRVEKILDKNYCKFENEDVWMYLIKWLGWDEATWEPVTNIENSWAMVAAFEVEKFNAFWLNKVKSDKMLLYWTDDRLEWEEQIYYHFRRFYQNLQILANASSEIFHQPHYLVRFSKLKDTPSDPIIKNHSALRKERLDFINLKHELPKELVAIKVPKDRQDTHSSEGLMDTCSNETGEDNAQQGAIKTESDEVCIVDGWEQRKISFLSVEEERFNEVLTILNGNVLHRLESEALLMFKKKGPDFAHFE